MISILKSVGKRHIYESNISRVAPNHETALFFHRL